MFSLGVIKRMNAKEARKQSVANKPGLCIDHLLNIVDRKINAAVEDGLTRIDRNPLEGLRMPISDEQMAAVRENLRGRGFKVSVGNPFSISW